MMMTAAGGIGFSGADHNNGIVVTGRPAVNEALGEGSGIFAVFAVAVSGGADGGMLVDRNSPGHQIRHRPEGAAGKVGIQAGADDVQAVAVMGKEKGVEKGQDFGEPGVKKLGFVDKDSI